MLAACHELQELIPTNHKLKRNKNVQVNSATLDWLEENTERLGISVEYCTKTDELCIKFANYALRVVYVRVLLRYFQHVAKESGHSKN